MATMPLKKAFSWVVLVVSGLVGVLGLAYLGLQDLSLATTDRLWASFIAASILFAVVPFSASAFALLNRRGCAALSFWLAVPIFARWAFLNATYVVFESRLYGGFAGVCLVLGFCWLVAWWRDWPALLSRPLSARRKAVFCFLTLFVIGTLDLGITFVLEGLPYETMIDCGRSGVFSRSTFGHDAVFTAHLIRVGHQLKASGTWIGSWAVARVQERFWGWRFPGIVMLTAAYGLRGGDDYLVDGRRPRGVLTRFLPIVEIRGCNRSARMADAAVELRLLRSGFPKNDVRIMGRVIKWAEERPTEPYALHAYALLQGVKVTITGPGATISATTDREGIYDVGGLPPGRYKAQLQSGGGIAFYDSWSDLKAGDVAEYSFWAE